MLQSLEVYKLFDMVRSFIEATVKNSSVYIYIYIYTPQSIFPKKCRDV